MGKVRRKAAEALGGASFEELAASLPDLEGDWEYLLEGLKIDIALQVTQAMKAAGVSGAELARRMGVEPPMVSRVLRHTGNVQLQTLAKMAAALDLEPVIKLLRKGEDDARVAERCAEDAAGFGLAKQSGVTAQSVPPKRAKAPAKPAATKPSPKSSKRA